MGEVFFNGWIDDFRIYGKVLDHDDVQAAWANGLGDFGPSQIFHPLIAPLHPCL